MLKNIGLIVSVFFMVFLGNTTLAQAQEITPNNSVYLRGWDGAIGSGYGMRMHPIRGYERMHNGVDIAGNNGGLLSSIESGTVESVLWDANGYGHYVIVDTPKFKFLVAHLNAVYVKPGQKVQQGDILGEIGSTGGSTGPHIHFEVTINGNRIDPMATVLNIKNHNKNYVSEADQRKILEEEQRKITEEMINIDAEREILAEMAEEIRLEKIEIERAKRDMVKERNLLYLFEELLSNELLLKDIESELENQRSFKSKFLSSIISSSNR